MANLKTFGDLRDRCAIRVGASRPDDVERIGEYALEALRDIYRRFKWPSRRRVAHLLTDAAIDISIDAATRGDDTITVTGLTDEHAKWFLNVGWGHPGYEIDSVDATSVILERPWAEDDVVASTPGKAYNHLLNLPPECAEVATEEIALLDSSGAPLSWKDRMTAGAEYVFPRSEGRPGWVTYGDHVLNSRGEVLFRRLRVGPNAPDNQYALRVGFWRSYPGDQTSDSPILIPEDLRDIAVWGTMMRAYTEPPWVNEVNATQMKQLYEVELDIALRTSSKEGDSEMFVVDRFDEGSYF